MNIAVFEAVQSASADNDLEGCLRTIEAHYPLCDWLLAKGRLSENEPPYGFRILMGADDVLAEGEGNSACEAILDAVKMRPK